MIRRIPLWTAAIGCAIGVLLGLTTTATSVAEAAYDRIYPVVVAEYEVSAKEPDRWLIVMWSHKQRDCTLMIPDGVIAYDERPDSVVRLTFERDDGEPPTRMPKGKFRSAVYRVSPAPIGTLRMSFYHQCGKRIARSDISAKG